MITGVFCANGTSNIVERFDALQADFHVIFKQHFKDKQEKG